MRIARSADTDDMEWTRRYEALRAHAVGEAPLDFVPLRLALLCHRGVVAWISAEMRASDPRVATGGSPALEQRTEDGVRGPSSELVPLLATTVLLVARRRAS